MVDAPPLRQVAGLQRVDEAAPPRDLHENGEAWGDTDTMPPRDLQLVHRLYLPISPHISPYLRYISRDLQLVQRAGPRRLGLGLQEHRHQPHLVREI